MYLPAKVEKPRDVSPYDGYGWKGNVDVGAVFKAGENGFSFTLKQLGFDKWAEEWQVQLDAHYNESLNEGFEVPVEFRTPTKFTSSRRVHQGVSPGADYEI